MKTQKRLSQSQLSMSHNTESPCILFSKIASILKFILPVFIAEIYQIKYISQIYNKVKLMSKLQTQQKQSQQNTYPSRQQYINKFLWPELINYGNQKIKYNPLGLSTLPIPQFHIRNTKESVQKMKIIDFQYQDPSKCLLKEKILEYFPPVKIFNGEDCQSKDENKKNGVKINEQNLLVTPGALNGISMAIQALVEPGQEVIIIQPFYTGHLVRLYSRHDIQLRTCQFTFDQNKNQKQQKFKMDFQSLKNILNEKSRILLICNPGNPCINMWSRQQFQTLAEVIKDYPNLVVIEDSVYFLFASNQNPYVPFGSLSQSNFNKSITFYSIGKMFNVTGIRIGIGIGPKHLVNRTLFVQYRQVSLPSAQDQYLMCYNLKSAFQLDFCKKQQEKHVKIFEKISRQFDKLRIPYLKWEGTYFFIVNVEKYRGKIDEKWYKRMDTGVVEDHNLDRAFSRLFCIEYSVGMIPLSENYFGNRYDNFVRLSFNRCDSDIQFMLDGFRKFAQSLEQQNLEVQSEGATNI